MCVVIATAYSGAAPGRPDCLEGACPRGQLSYDEVPGLGDYARPGTPGFCIAIHAEVNALLFSTRDTKGAVAYITDDDIARFEYLKKPARNLGAVLIGNETMRAENFADLTAKLDALSSQSALGSLPTAKLIEFLAYDLVDHHALGADRDIIPWLRVGARNDAPPAAN